MDTVCCETVNRLARRSLLKRNPKPDPSPQPEITKPELGSSEPERKSKRPCKREFERRSQLLNALKCQMVDKTAGIFIVRSSAVGVGFPVHVIFKKTHPKEFYCEIGCEMQDRQLCKHLSAVERYVRDNNIYMDDEQEIADVNEDFPDLDQIELFDRITDDEKCDVYTLHNYCLDNNTPVIMPFHANNDSTSAFYSVCTSTIKGVKPKSGRVVTTYDKKTQKYKCKCLYRECVHQMVVKLYRAGQGHKDCYGENTLGSAGVPMTATHHRFNKQIRGGWKKRKSNLFVQ